MSPSLFIIQANGDFYYDLFYLLAFLAGYLLLLGIGVKRNYHLATWMLVLAGIRLLFIMGTKLFSYTAQEWQVLLTEHSLPPTTGKILPGGLLLAALGFFLFKRLFRLKNDTLDAFALVLPLSIALQRPGCLLAGCCYGKLTTGFWGVQYPPGTLAHFHQFQAGLIQAGDLNSLPVHPWQLYEALNGLLVVAILLLVKRHIKAPGNAFTCSVLLYSFFRFFTEFLRSPLAHASGGTMAGGLKIIQWCLLATFLLLGAVFIYREKTFKPEASSPAPASLPASLLLLLAMAFSAWALRFWFTYTELMALNMVLYPAIFVAGIYFFKSVISPQGRWLALGTLVLPVMLMSQTVPEKSPREEKDSGETTSYQTFKIGYGSGNYQNSHTIGQGSGCDRVSQTRYFEQDYSLGGAGYALTRKTARQEISYGLNAFYGTHRQTDITPLTGGKQVNTTLYGVNPFIRYDHKFYGLGIGAHLGRLLYTLENPDTDGTGTPESGSKTTPIYPQVYVRAGPTRIVFVDFHLADQFPSGLPGLRYQLGIGSGLGLKNGSFIRYGSNTVDQFISSHIVLRNRLVVEPLFLWGTSPAPGQARQRQFTLGLHYRFNHQAGK